MTTPNPNVDYTKEIRFAVVMYGGVSLAIYINGIAQELLSLVRSTARSRRTSKGRTTLSGLKITGPDDPNKEKKLRGTERVYRKLSYLLSDAALLSQYRDWLKHQALEGQIVPPPRDMMDDYLERDQPEPITTGFVVDILSGTSAGGINAVFLAKALANDQSIDRLKQLWVEEGDIGVLLNDKQSVAGLHLRNQEPPRSLLNSRRMYLKLLRALDEMDTPDTKENPNDSPYVDELDLFVTATDIQGLPLPIRLSDMNVLERRHKNVFRFKYASENSVFGGTCNDFTAENNPFLAFSARCTSSFPFAFEPMKLSDIDEVLDVFPNYRGTSAAQSRSKKWRRFFPFFVDPDTGDEVADYRTRAFGDGGYLDNKPFSYPTEALSRRENRVPVDRKLIYIEPSPEHLDSQERNETPDALANAKAALIDLPGYETIREDIERVIARNRLINRVNRIGAAIEVDLDVAADRTNWKRPQLHGGEWKTLDLADMVERFGVYYLPYRRLRIAAATDELAKLVSRTLNLDENSAYYFAVRILIRAWREINYPDYHAQTEGEKTDGENKEGEEPPTANQFLIDFDFKYWLRRLTFIRAKLDQLFRLEGLPVSLDGHDLDWDRLSDTEKATVTRLNSLKYHRLDYRRLTTEQKAEFRKVVSYLKCELSEVFKSLREKGRTAHSRSAKEKTDDSFTAKLSKISIGKETLNKLLGLTSADDDLDFAKLDEEACVRRAKAWFASEHPDDRPGIATQLDEAAKALKVELKTTVVDPTWERCSALLKAVIVHADKSVTRNPLPKPQDKCAAQVVESEYTDSIREYLWRYFSQFDDFDQVRFPILYGTEVGESDIVEIFRISPEDAPSLINEKDPNTGRRKLAGTALFHFGAFLDRVWRENDIMWGRLDGAERLITALLPDPDNKVVRDQLIAEAHRAILIEEMPPKAREELSALLAQALIRVSSGETFEQALVRVMGPLTDTKVKSRLETAMRACLADEKLLSFVQQAYEVNRDLEPKPLLRAVARATQVIGKILDEVAGAREVPNKAIPWIARIGRIFWGLVEVAVPGSVANLLLFHWLKLLYVLEVLLVVGAVLLASDSVKQFAWTALGLTVGLNLVVLLLRDYMRGRKWWAHALLVLIALVFLYLSALGISDIFHLGWKGSLVALAALVKGWIVKLSTRS